MKHLLYLNKEYLYSYYAQAFDGIDKTTQKSVSDATVSEEERIGESVTHKGNAKVNLFGLAELGGGSEVSEENVNTRFITLEAARDVATIALHDNALDRVIEHSQCKNGEEKRIGDYVEITGSFQMIDFDYWLSILSDDFINRASEMKWKNYCKTLSNPNAKEIERGKKMFIDKEKYALRDARNNLMFSKSVSQADVMMAVDGTIVPMKRDYMKETTREMMFKYESKVHVFGRITREHQKIDNNETNVVQALSDSFNTIWLEWLTNTGIIKNDGMCTVVDPIAIYVE